MATTTQMGVPYHLLGENPIAFSARLFSTSSSSLSDEAPSPPTSFSPPKLTHLNKSGEAHMVSISDKAPTKRTAVAVCSVIFSNPTVQTLISENRAEKGDVLGVARVAGIMAAKQTPNLVPLCHPIAITHVGVDLKLEVESVQKDGEQVKANGKVRIRATVSCDGKTGVEMEALTAASTAALTVYDMCKAVDKGMRIDGLKVVKKEGGKSGTWVDGEAVEETPAQG